MPICYGPTVDFKARCHDINDAFSGEGYYTQLYPHCSESYQNGAQGLLVCTRLYFGNLNSKYIASLTSPRTGITGYIGGDAFFSITQAHPDWQLSVLVRNKDKGAKLASQYPQVRIVHGDLESADILEEEVKNADIVYRTCYTFPWIIEITGTNVSRLR